MSAFRDSVKPYFVTGAYPTQAQFWDFLSKVQFKDEIPGRISAIGQSVIPIPAGSWVDKIAVVTTGTITVNAGTTEGGDDVLKNEEIDLVEGFDITDINFPQAGNLYFTGILPNTEIIIFTR